MVGIFFAKNAKKKVVKIDDLFISISEIKLPRRGELTLQCKGDLLE